LRTDPGDSSRFAAHRRGRHLEASRDGVSAITKIALGATGKVPGLDEAAFIEHANTAKAGCPVIRALASVPEITLEASLS
jgi:osmotically inducible protein OsmC